MGARTMVEQTRTGLPKMAKPPTQIGILPGPLPRLYMGHAVADMLAHSPSLPLVIDYDDKDRYITVEKEERIILALRQRDRVHRVRLGMPVPIMAKLIMAIDEGYPRIPDSYVFGGVRHTGLGAS